MHNLYSRALMCALFILWQCRKGCSLFVKGVKNISRMKKQQKYHRKPIIHLYRLTSPNVVESSLIIRNKKNAIIGRSNCNIS